MSSSSSSFWSAIADYAAELAPVAGPLLAAVSDTAAAIDRAGTSPRALRGSSAALDATLLPPIDVPATPAPSRRPRARKTKVTATHA